MLNFKPVIFEMVICRFFKMAAVRHIGFVIRHFEPPTKITWLSSSLCEIWLESVQYSFDNMQVFNTLHIWLENAYSSSCGGVLGKNKGKRKPFAVLSLWEYNNLGLTFHESNSVKIASAVLSRDASKNCGHKKIETTRE